MVDLDKEYVKLDVGKTVDWVVDNMTRGRCIPIDLMKSRDCYSNFDHNSKNRDYIESDKTKLAYLVGSCYAMPGWRYSSKKRLG